METVSENINDLGKTLVLSNGEQYRRLEIAARQDDTYISDYEAAFLAPALILENEGKVQFEEVFDKILFHLENAYDKAGACVDDQRKVSRVAQELFFSQVVAVQNRIDGKARKSRAGIFEAIKNGFLSFKKLVGHVGSENIIGATSELGELGSVFTQFLVHLTDKWELGKDREYFYGQTANIYLKIIKSKCYDSNFTLIRNVFKTKKEELLSHIVRVRGLTSALAMTQYDFDAEEKNESARVIIKELMASKDWEGALDLIRIVKEHNLSSLEEIKRNTVTAYKIALSEGSAACGNTSSGSKTATNIFRVFMAFGALYLLIPIFALLSFLSGLFVSIYHAPPCPTEFWPIVRYVLGILAISAGWGLLFGAALILVVLLVAFICRIYSAVTILIRAAKWTKRVYSI